MSNIATKLTYLNGTKQAIKQAINEDFEVIDDNTTFREYADEISSNNAKYKDLIPKETKNATNTLDISNSAGLDKTLVTQYGNTYQETTTGKNLFNKDTITSVYHGILNNDVISINTDDRGVTINFSSISLPAGTYYLSADIKKVDGSKSFVNINDGENVYEIVEAPTLSSSYQRYMCKYTYTDTKNLNVMYISFTNSTGVCNIRNIMISNSSDINYEKYSGGNPAPNPDYPQEIVNISGKSTLKDVGKNLFDKDNTNIINAYINNSVIKVTGVDGGSFYIPCEPNTTYTVSKTELFGNDRFCVFDTYRIPTAGDTILSYVGKPTGGNSDTSLTITTNATATYLGIFVKAGETSPAKTFQEIADTIQVEKNSTASEYEPYQEQSYEINLGYNLFKTPYNESSTTKNGITFTINEDGSIHVEGTATAKTQFNLRNRDLLLGLNIGERYTIATSGLGTADSTIWLDTYGQTGNFLGRWALTSSTSYASAVAEAKDNKPLISITVENGATINTDVKVWLYKGAYDSSIEYTQYETPIELCKIGTYKDRIYPLNGKWYLEKKIGKVVLNGSESYNSLGGSGSNPYYAFYNNNTLVSNSINASTLYTNYFRTDYTPGLLQKDGGCRIADYNSVNRVFFCIHSITSVNDFKTWLSTHNTSLYYVLATPTTEEITESNYPTLYNQLNNIKLFEGVNHITMTNESGLDVEFDIEYYKDWKLD